MMNSPEHFDEVITASLTSLETDAVDPERIAEAKERVLAHFDELVASDRPRSQPVPEAIELSPHPAAPERRHWLVAAAAVVLVTVGAVLIARGNQSPQQVDTANTEESAPDNPPTTAADPLAGADWMPPDGFEITSRSAGAITAVSTEGNTGITVLADEGQQSLDGRIRDLVERELLQSTRRGAQVGGEFVDMYEVFVTATESEARQCEVASPCLPLIDGSDPLTWFRSTYHHDVLPIEQGTDRRLVLIVWTDRPFTTEFSQVVNEVVDSLSS